MASRSSRRKKYSKEERTPTQWSEWAWDKERECYGRYRLDKYGEYEYEYETQETNESTTTSGYQDSRSSETPRYAPSYEQSSQAAFSTSPVTPDYTTSAYTEATAAFGNLDLNKGKERETEEYAPSVTTSYSATPSVAPVMRTASTIIDTNWNTAGNTSIYSPQYIQDTGAPPYQQPSYPYGEQYPQKSSSASSQQPFYPDQAWPSNAGNPADHTPFAPQGGNHIGTGTRGLESPLDSHFKVHPGSKFEVGKVFKILWAEPTGINGTQLTGGGTEPARSHSHKFREPFVHKIRRFVVVKAFNAHCLGLPIHTYQHQGTTKSGAQAQHHAAIYSDKEIIYEGENLTKRAVRVEMFTPREKLDSASRINYAKVYTIEYNVKVHFIGRVYGRHMSRVLGDYHSTQGLGFQDTPYTYEDSTGGQGPAR